MPIINKLSPRLREMTVELKRQWVGQVMAQHAEAGLLVFGKTCESEKNGVDALAEASQKNSETSGTLLCTLYFVCLNPYGML